jgi:putative addiction module component (TIGR02574 family)
MACQEDGMDVTTIFDLSPSEKLQLVEDLWDDLAASPSDVPLYDWQKKELEKRKLRLMRNPESGISWNEIKRRVRRQHER